MQEINRVNEKIASLTEEQRNPYYDHSKIKGVIKELQKQRDEQKSKLRKLQIGTASSAKHRQKRKRQLAIYSEQNPDDKSCIIKEKAGRPHIELYFPGFSAVLMDIVNHHCATGHTFTSFTWINIISCITFHFGMLFGVGGFRGHNQTVFVIQLACDIFSIFRSKKKIRNAYLL